MKKKIKLNEPLLRRVQKWLRRLKHPEHFNMDLYADKNECGTSFCIAGKVLDLEGYKVYKREKGRVFGADAYGFLKRDLDIDPHEEARKLLGLSVPQSDLLFFSMLWPNLGGPRYYITPKDGADYIDKFIEAAKSGKI